ncbi:19536_t:CDS:2 [Funneliformis geosporum]|nr:19536_t:CDS:2 [Funneliformis geosporum]
MSNISYLETLALNILNNIFTEKVAESVVISEQEPCSKCNKELFLYEIKRPLTILSYGHTFYHDCIESSIKISSLCPRPDCKKEVELAVLKSPRNLIDNNLMDISPSLFNDSPILQNDFQKKRSNDPLFPEVSPNKKARKLDNRNVSPKLKKMIEELSSETPQDQEVIKDSMLQEDFFILFDAIVKIEEQTENGIEEDHDLRSIVDQAIGFASNLYSEEPSRQLKLLRILPQEQD